MAQRSKWKIWLQETLPIKWYRLLRASWQKARSTLHFGWELRRRWALRSRPAIQAQYTLAVCTVAQPGATLSQEWLEFHRLVGVEHFYVYGQGEANPPSTTQPDITWHAWGEKSVENAYAHCLHSYAKQTSWLAFLNVADYLFGTMEDDLRVVLADYQEYPGLRIERVPMRKVGGVSKTGDLLIETHMNTVGRYGMSTQQREELRRCTKPLINTRFLPGKVLSPFRIRMALRLEPVEEIYLPEALRRGVWPHGVDDLMTGRVQLNYYPCLDLGAGSERDDAWLADWTRSIRHPGRLDLSIQRFTPRLRQRLGLVSETCTPVQIDENAIDRYRSVGSPLPAPRTTPPREMVVLGLQRSGNHILIDWLLSALKAPWLFSNNVRLESTPFQVEKMTRMSGLSAAGIEQLNEPEARHRFAGQLVVSHEDFSAALLGDWLRQHEPYIGERADQVCLLILRDPYNLFASRLKRFRGNRNRQGTIPFDRYGVGLLRERWVEHALEFIGQTAHLPNLVPVDYTRFTSDREYRQSLARRLGITPDDAIINHVSSAARGSSFDRRRFDGRASEMRVGERWRVLANDPLYCHALDDERIQQLAELIFGYPSDFLATARQASSQLDA